jgi:hypothetical protein
MSPSFFTGILVALIACAITLSYLAYDPSTLSSLGIASGVCSLSSTTGSSEEDPLLQIKETTVLVRETTPSVLDYHFHADEFTQSFAACVLDNNCRVVYHHVPKTAGTTIEQVASKLFRLPVALPSCCDDSVIDRFKQSQAKYCGRKFSSYQVNGTQFVKIVHSCQLFHSSRNYSQPQRAVVLSSYREPIARTLSYVSLSCSTCHVSSCLINENCSLTGVALKKDPPTMQQGSQATDPTILGNM